MEILRLLMCCIVCLFLSQGPTPLAAQESLFTGVAQRFAQASQSQGTGVVLIATNFNCAIGFKEPCHKFGRELAEKFGSAYRQADSKSIVFSRNDQQELLRKSGFLQIDEHDRDMPRLIALTIGAAYITGDLRREANGWQLKLRMATPKNETTLAEETISLPPESTNMLREEPVMDPGGVYWAGAGGVSFPKCKECPRPPYTDAAYKLKIQGRVLMLATVGVTGSVESIRVVQGLPEGLTEASVEIAKKWKLEPAKTEDGRPVPARVTLEITFRIHAGP